MATNLKLLKFANSISRGKSALLYELSEVYKPAITRNKEKLTGLIREKAERASKSELARKMNDLKGFYTVEMAPPRGNEMERLVKDLKLSQDFFKKGAFMHVTVKQAWLLFLVGLEVALWFYIGETIGKFHIVGYAV